MPRVAEETPVAPPDPEQFWRGRSAQARVRLEAAQSQYDRLQRAIRMGQPAMYDGNGQRVQYSAQDLKAMADAAEAELAAAQAGLDAVLEEGRRAGALPGWLR